MKKLKELFEKAFNTNTGYFIKKVIYWYQGRSEVGYVLCRGFVMFGIPGYDRLGVFVDQEDAIRDLKIWQGVTQ